MTYGPWIIGFDDGGRPICAPVPPELGTTWQQVARSYPSPIGAAGEQQFTGSKRIAPGETTEIARWTGSPGRPSSVRLSVVAVAEAQNDNQQQPPLAPVLNTSNVDENVFARVTWSVGLLRYTADLDLNAGSLALTLVATDVKISIVNGGTNTCAFASAIGEDAGRQHSGQFCEARRTIKAALAATPAQTLIAIPPFARAVWLGTVNPAQFTITSLDGKGAISNLSLQQGNTGSPRFFQELPNGCLNLGIVTNSAAILNVTLVFMLGLP